MTAALGWHPLGAVAFLHGVPPGVYRCQDLGVMSQNPALTILILCRDEESSIAHCVREAQEFLQRHAIAGEVVVVDNGSRDRSAELASATGARVVVEPRAGYGNAIIGGIAAARGRFIILATGRRTRPERAGAVLGRAARR